MTAPAATSLPLPAWLAQLAALDLTAIEVSVAYRGPVRLADPVNAVVRGLFGERLRDLRCLTRAPTCDGCADAAGCDYARVFGSEIACLDGPGGSRGPHPYWLQGFPASCELGAGTRLTARLVIAAPAAPITAYLDVALRDAVARLGAAPGERLAELSPSRIRRLVFPTGDAAEGACQWRIETRTPLVLRGDLDACERACPRAPWLALLVRAGVRRIDALVRAFAPGASPPRVDKPALDDVEVIEGRIARWQGSRFSQRQGQRFPLDGLVGSAVVRGQAMSAVGRLFRALTVTSVGKATTMGFGVLAAEPVP